MPQSHWQFAPSRRDEARALAQRLSVHPVVAHILLNRGIADEAVAEFLDPSLASCHDACLLRDIDRAAARLALAVEQGQKVVVYGDYDADGCCAGAIMARFLTFCETPFEYYVPRREEGYGLSLEAVIEIITQHKPKLIVTVDCGITACGEIQAALSFGVDVIVTDHHQVPEKLPTVPAVDPHRGDCGYPFKELCGAAVAYKLCRQTAALLGRELGELDHTLLELVMIGTVADVMPLIGENRYYTKAGLKLLGQTRSIGLRALLEVARLDPQRLCSRDIAFGVGPRLNAAGRLETATMAYELLVTTDRARAYELAEALDRCNRERQEIEQRTTDEAFEQVKELSLHDTWGVVVAGSGWHEGVLGLVAGRLCRQLHRPVLALTLNGERAKGSGRSTPAVDLYAALSACAPLFERFGGHPRAAGLSLAKEQLPALREQFNAAVRAQITEDDLLPVITIECAVKAAAADLRLAEALERLAPYGEGNPSPVLEVRGLRIGEARATRDGVHLQLRFVYDTPRGPGELKGFWPRMGRLAERLHRGAEATVAATLGIDTWQGNRRPQLLVEDLRLEATGHS
ncbi:MAG: single-stranded-DNA-specific exonuclease RecJ [Armatimonadetes bacterium]|nr:single-stranded-DNA-specific exonuclease RecJ [Armatimonadota bacterium]